MLTTGHALDHGGPERVRLENDAYIGRLDRRIRLWDSWTLGLGSGRDSGLWGTLGLGDSGTLGIWDLGLWSSGSGTLGLWRPGTW